MLTAIPAVTLMRQNCTIYVFLASSDKQPVTFTKLKCLAKDFAVIKISMIKTAFLAGLKTATL